MSSYLVKSPKKLIEVALPLDDINAESALRKRKAPAGYPTTLHTWWAQRPLAAARAVIFAQLVNDPSWKWDMDHPGEVPPNHLKASWAASRKRLFAIMTELVRWENSTNTEVLSKAAAEIRRSWREVCEVNGAHPDAETLFNPSRPPPVYDPFAGGGSIPLEAQRLGQVALASDLNPVAVLINKALIEVPPVFAGRPPVHPRAERRTSWSGALGLAEDVRRFGAWVKEQAEQRIGAFYPKLDVPTGLPDRPDLAGLEGKSVSATAWLWVRTVRSPNPAFSHVHVPLASTFVLSSKPGKEIWVEPMIVGDTYTFEVRFGRPSAAAKSGTTAGKRAAFRCLLSDVPIDYNYIRAEGRSGRIALRLMAAVAQGGRARVYLSPTEEAQAVALSATADWKPELALPSNTRDFKTPNYGMSTFGDIFTSRQLLALNTFAEVVIEVREKVLEFSRLAGLPDDDVPLEQGGTGARAYADAVSLYLAFAISRVADYGSTISTWRPKDNAMRATLGKQAIPMAWDFAEGSPFGGSSSGFVESVRVVSRVLEFLPFSPERGKAWQAPAQEAAVPEPPVISTDPPYYDNIGYADLSDFFYVWLRRTLRPVFPALFATMAVPKREELVATPYRHGSKETAEAFFLDGMTQAMHRLAVASHPSMPVTIYYAFKQSETKAEAGTSSTGWETFLEAVLRAGFSVTGTWPMRTEGDNRQIGNNANALASSIVLVCRRRPEAASEVSRREFLRELNTVLPEALDEMTKGAGDDRAPVAPVDLSQAIIGPGMAVFSKYAAVLEADGTPMSVKTALQLINRFLAEDDFDADTQFCLRWFDQHGWTEGAYGDADVLARAKATSVGGLDHAGVLVSGGGKVRLRKWSEYPEVWNPRTDKRLPVWEALHQLIRTFRKDGEAGAGQILGAVKSKTEAIRQLAYRLYTLCERRGWAEDARAYNDLVTSWAAIETVANAVPEPVSQLGLFGES